MVDQTVELQPLDGKDLKLTGREGFKEIVDQFGKEITKGSYVNLDDLLEKVLALESKFDLPQLTDQEFEVLCLTSYILGVAKKNIDVMRGPKTEEEIRKAWLESIELQQYAVRLVLANINVETGEFDKGVAKQFFYLTDIFQNYFEEIGAGRREGFLRGVKGMVTSALLFKFIGWEVALPDPEYDLNYETDLFVQNPDGEIYSVDVTARVPKIVRGEREKAFRLDEVKKHRRLGKDDWTNVSGFLCLNVPPLIHYGSHGFYENRSMGVPNKKTVEEFRAMVEERAKII